MSDFDAEGDEVGVMTARLTIEAVPVVDSGWVSSLVFSGESQSSSPRCRAHNLLGSQFSDRARTNVLYLLGSMYSL